jgi:hypothetical protein
MQPAMQSSDTTVDLHAQLSVAQKKIEQQKSYIDQLEEFIRSLHQKQFGASSEAQDTLQSGLFDEGESEPADDSALTEDTVMVAAHERQPRKPARIPAELPREEIIHDLADADKVCYRGALMVDGYEGYSAVCATQALIRLGCWAHARRKFIEAQKAQAKHKTGKADQALAFIQALYRIEQLAKDTSPEERHAIRDTQARPIVDKIRQWMEKSVPHTPPKTLLGKALFYLQHQWPHLIRYLEDGRYPINNNAAENTIRPFVVGRKNWLFSASPSGATASANLYSLIETAKANGIEPYVYLRRVFTDLPNAQRVEQIEALLPWNVKSGGG